MSIWLLYLLFVVIPNANVFTKGMVIASVSAAFVAGFVIIMSLDFGPKETVKRGQFWFKAGMASAVFFAFLSLFIPSDTQMWTVAGGYVAANNAELKKLPDNVLKTANSYLEKLQHSIEGKPDDGKKK